MISFYKVHVPIFTLTACMDRFKRRKTNDRRQRKDDLGIENHESDGSFDNVTIVNGNECSRELSRPSGTAIIINQGYLSYG